jgi:hypothetical protein
MPEMNELMGDTSDKRNYLTQDDMGDSRLAKFGAKKKNRKQREIRSDSADEEMTKVNNVKNFTPGRIRASKMGSN